MCHKEYVLSEGKFTKYLLQKLPILFFLLNKYHSLNGNAEFRLIYLGIKYLFLKWPWCICTFLNMHWSVIMQMSATSVSTKMQNV